MPERDQNDDDGGIQGQLKIRSIREVIEERHPDGKVVRRVLTDRMGFVKFRFPLKRWGVILILVIIAVVIGLYAVGPHEVWTWLRELISSLASSDSLPADI